MRVCTYGRRGVIALFAVAGFVLATGASAQGTEKALFPWPSGRKEALSITFDDGFNSQMDRGLAILDEFDIKVTFYPLPSRVEERLEGWKRAVASGHEIGNHSIGHPCTGNFAWVRREGVQLEHYSLKKMRAELLRANDELEKLLGVRPVSFAYPCGQTTVGRGRAAQSYVPLVAELFSSGRGWMDETTNMPAYFDYAQILTLPMDGQPFAEIKPLVDRVVADGQWLVLAGHRVGQSRRLTTDEQMLRELLAYLKSIDEELWVAPVKDVVAHVKKYRVGDNDITAAKK